MDNTPTSVTKKSQSRQAKKGPVFFSDVKNDIAHVFIITVDRNKSKYTIK